MITNLHTPTKKSVGILNIDWIRTSLLHINLGITKNTDPHEFSIFIYSTLIITNTHISLRKLNHSSGKTTSGWTFASIMFENTSDVLHSCENEYDIWYEINKQRALNVLQLSNTFFHYVFVSQRTADMTWTWPHFWRNLFLNKFSIALLWNFKSWIKWRTFHMSTRLCAGV